MGRQINYYMEADVFKTLLQKAIDLEFQILQNNYTTTEAVTRLDDVLFTDNNNRYYLYLPEAGSLIYKETGWLDDMQSPVIEANYSTVQNNVVSRARLWTPTGYWNNEDIFIYRPEKLDKKYSSLVRFVKKLAPYTEIPVTSRNRSTFMSKCYITKSLLESVESGQYACEA